MAGERHAAALMDRAGERSALDGLLATVRAGRSQVLVLHGEAGVGKTALLDYLAGQAAGCRVVRAAGVQSEMELAFAGLHQLCAPLLRWIGLVPEPQRDALNTAFGISPGPAPDRLLIGLAVLSLLSAAAGDEPLVVVIDDLQWLDQASSQALGFVARRLAADPVGLVFAARDPGEEVDGLPRLTVNGLPQAHARALLDSVLTGTVDGRVRDQIVAESGGNPLALLELPRGLSAAEMAGGFGVLDGSQLPGRIEESFRRQIGALPDDTQRLLVLAAADPSGDPLLVWRAAGRLGIGLAAARPAAEAGLAQFGARVRFRHPLVRSTAYRSAADQDRRRAHAELARATDRGTDPDRRAWHRAQAASRPDEDVAEELERSAGRARARGGLAAAAAFLERAAVLTPDPGRRAGRALDAAAAKLQAGAYDAARDLLAAAQAGPLSALARAQVDLLRARLAFVTSRGSDAPLPLLEVARRLEPFDPGLSRAAYLDALLAAMYAGRLAAPGGDTRAVARAAAAAPPPAGAPSARDLLLDGLAATFGAGYVASVPSLRRALDSLCDGATADEELRLVFLGTVVAEDLWDDESWAKLSDHAVELARAAGALTDLLPALSAQVVVLLLAGELAAAASVAGEMQAVMDATGSNIAPYGSLGLAALRGRADEVAALREAVTRDVMARGEGTGIAILEWSNAVLANGRGRYQEAMAAAGRLLAYQRDMGSYNWALAELVEAAARGGMTEAAAGALGQLAEMTAASGTDWALGVAARCRALLSEGEAAERLYEEAIARLGRTRMRPDLARAHLLYGEWLRRERRRGEAREQLRTACAMLEEMGMGAFAERARRELQATGGTARKRSDPASDKQLSPQEAQIARLAEEGLSNPEIGARLFISARTVQYHLGNVFAKLGIGSRGELHFALGHVPAGREEGPDAAERAEGRSLSPGASGALRERVPPAADHREPGGDQEHQRRPGDRPGAEVRDQQAAEQAARGDGRGEDRDGDRLSLVGGAFGRVDRGRDEQAGRAAEREAPGHGRDVDQRGHAGEAGEDERAEREQQRAAHGEPPQVVVNVPADHEDAQDGGGAEGEEHPARLAGHARVVQVVRDVGVDDVVRHHVRGEREQDRPQPGDDQGLRDLDAFLGRLPGQVRQRREDPRHVQRRQRRGGVEGDLPPAEPADPGAKRDAKGQRHGSARQGDGDGAAAYRGMGQPRAVTPEQRPDQAGAQAGDKADHQGQRVVAGHRRERVGHGNDA